MFPWSVDKRVDNQQTRPLIFPNGGVINALPPSNPTTSLEQNSRDTVQEVRLNGISSGFVVLLKSIQRSSVIDLVSDLHLRWTNKAIPVLRLTIHDLLIAITTRIHLDSHTRCNALEGTSEDASSSGVVLDCLQFRNAVQVTQDSITRDLTLQ